MRNVYQKLIAFINITSLADISFTLMVIFLIAGITAAFSRLGLSVKLPQSAYLRPQIKEGVLITINEKGEIFVEEEEVSKKDLIKTIYKYLEKKGSDKVYLQADKNLPYGKIIEILGDIKNAGIIDVGLLATAVRKK
uniref:Biopolymer transporter ExbD n=1 Tax=candidate division WOR-3 bacterium TaxID=2052148 RepID=A0A7V6CN07_UNCW3